MTEITTDFISTELKKYNVTDDYLKKLKDKYMPIKVNGIDDDENYEIAKSAHQEVKGLRVDIEKKRKELKSASLEFGRAVDGEAKRLTAEVTKVEAHLYEQRRIVEAEKERAKKEMEEQIRLEQERAKREEEERLENIRKEQEEKERKLREEQEKLLEEKRKFEEEKRIEEAKKQARIEAEERAKRERIEAAQRAEEEKKRAVEEAERKAQEEKQRIIDEQNAKEKAQKEAEERAKAKEEAARIEKERQESLKPDIEKIHAFGVMLSKLTYPEFQTNEAFEIMDKAECSILKIAKELIATKL